MSLPFPLFTVVLVVVICYLIFYYLSYEIKLVRPLRNKYKLKLTGWTFLYIKILAQNIKNNKTYKLKYEPFDPVDYFVVDNIITSLLDFKQNNLTFWIGWNGHHKGLLLKRIITEGEYKREFNNLVIYSNNQDFANSFSNTDLEELNSMVNIRHYSISVHKESNDSTNINCGFINIFGGLDEDVFETVIKALEMVSSKADNY